MLAMEDPDLFATRGGGPMMASMAYLAIIITVLLSYIVPGSSKSLRGYYLPEKDSPIAEVLGGEGEKADGMDMDPENDSEPEEEGEEESGEESLEEDGENSSGSGSRTSISFDLSKVPKDEACRFLLRCPQELLGGLSFTLDKEEIELPLKKIGKKDLWLLEVKSTASEKRSKFRARSRSEA